MSDQTPPQAQQVKVADPHEVQETVCDGPINISWLNNRATITFTHPRPKLEPLFIGQLQFEFVVRARIATSMENLIGLRDMLIQQFPLDKPAVTPSSGGASTLH